MKISANIMTNERKLIMKSNGNNINKLVIIANI